MATSLLDQFMAELDARGHGSGGLRAGQRATGFPTGTAQGNYLHGDIGLPGSTPTIFGFSGVEQDFFSTRIQPYGISGMLPAMGTIRTHPLFGYLTSFGAESGSNPTGVCDDPMTAGAVSTCLQTAQFGRYSYQTREFAIDQAGLQGNRGEFLDLRLVNDPLVNFSATGDITSPPSSRGAFNFRMEMATRMLELGVSFQNKLARQLWNGNPANNTSGSGYMEFPGLNILISTNKWDALTNTACPSLNSDIKNFNYNKVDAVSNDAGGGIVRTMSYMFRYLRNNSRRMNMDPVEWVIAMREELFYEITAIWPCAYMTTGCTTFTNNGVNSLVINANDQVAMRDDLRQNRYLMIDGIRVNVVLDDGITELSSTDTNRIGTGCFGSDVYFIPLTVKGGMAVTYFEFQDFQQTAMAEVAEGNLSSYFWTDGGRYLWHTKSPVNYCVQLTSMIKPRLVLRTPHLAGRIQNIVYCPLQHVRTPFSGDPYGPATTDGVSAGRYGPSLYSDWRHA